MESGLFGVSECIRLHFLSIIFNPSIIFIHHCRYVTHYLFYFILNNIRVYVGNIQFERYRLKYFGINEKIKTYL
jgi:hypothetical protein